MSRLKKAPGELAKDNFRREIRIRQGYYDLMTQRERTAEAVKLTAVAGRLDKNEKRRLAKKVPKKQQEVLL